MTRCELLHVGIECYTHTYVPAESHHHLQVNLHYILKRQGKRATELMAKSPSTIRVSECKYDIILADVEPYSSVYTLPAALQEEQSISSQIRAHLSQL